MTATQGRASPFTKILLGTGWRELRRAEECRVSQPKCKGRRFATPSSFPVDADSAQSPSAVRTAMICTSARPSRGRWRSHQTLPFLIVHGSPNRADSPAIR